MGQFLIQKIKFNKGNMMCWTVTSRTSISGKVTLKDDNTTYFSCSKGSNYDIQVLESGCKEYLGGSNLRIEFDINTGSALGVSKSLNGILNEDSEQKGAIYNFCIEDSTDKDYDDFYVNLVGWYR